MLSTLCVGIASITRCSTSAPNTSPQPHERRGGPSIGVVGGATGVDGSGGEEEVRTVSEGQYEGAPDSASRGAFPTGDGGASGVDAEAPIVGGHRGVPSRSTC